MKILQINAVLNSGSTGTIVRDIGNLVEKTGHTALYAAPNAIPSEYEYRIGGMLDHKIHAFLCRVLGKQGYYSHFATFKLLKWIKKKKPDIVHLHNIHSNFLNYKMLFKYLANNHIQTVITLHDCWFFTGKCFHFLYDNCNRWQNNCGCCPRIHAEQNSLWFDATNKVLRDKAFYIGHNKYVTVVTVSNWLKEMTQKSILSERKTYVIHNGVNLNIFKQIPESRKKLGIEKDKFIILGMANKWLSLENKATFDYFTKNLPTNYSLILIGCTEEQINNLPEGIEGVPHITSHKLAYYYSAADVFVNVTKVDSFPTVNLESIACGTPVVSYDSGGSKECIVEGKNGYIVPYGDFGALTNAISNIERRGKSFFSDFCRKIAEEKYDKASCYDDYLRLYISLKNSENFSQDKEIK